MKRFKPHHYTQLALALNVGGALDGGYRLQDYVMAIVVCLTLEVALRLYAFFASPQMPRRKMSADGGVQFSTECPYKAYPVGERGAELFIADPRTHEYLKRRLSER